MAPLAGGGAIAERAEYAGAEGLMELVVLNIGLDLGGISPRLFSIMILMSIVTTLMTAPLLRWIAPELTAPEAAGDLGRMEAAV